MPPSPKSQNIESYAYALEVHLSNLHTRLAATLDTLDEITRNHEVELAGLHDQARYFRAKCQVFEARAKDAEAERDELKADVNKLVEKVEIANDHRVLPRSRIHLPYPLEPVPPQSPTRLEEDIHRDIYFPAILTSLNAELRAEKYSFSELQRVSEARIATLEAQVARREAELYSYKPCSCRSGATSDPSASGAHKPRFQPIETTLSKAQYTSIEKETAVRQRTLEVEIDGLRRKLQSTKPEAFCSQPPRLAPQGLQDTGANFRHLLSSRPTTHLIHPDQTNPALSDIDRQLARISKEVDNLQAERDNVKVGIDMGREDDDGCPDGINDDNFKGVLLIEEECIRLRTSERSLRQELLLVTAAASATEQSLKSLVNKLRRQIRTLDNPDTSGVSTREEDSLNNVASEQTITIQHAPLSTPPFRSSTPLAQSTGATPPPGIRHEDSNYESPSSDRSISARPLSPSHGSVTRVARIESELNQARSDVKEKDRVISTLRGQLVVLQKTAQARTLRIRGRSWHSTDSEENG